MQCNSVQLDGDPDSAPAEVDAHYTLAAGIKGDIPALRSSLDGNAPSLIDCPIDYRENEKVSQGF